MLFNNLFGIGSKPYFTGDKPTEADCAFFGMLAQVVWAAPDSCYEQLVNGKRLNSFEKNTFIKVAIVPNR